MQKILTDREVIISEGENYTSREIREMLDPFSPALFGGVSVFVVSPSPVFQIQERKLRMLAILRSTTEKAEGKSRMIL